MAFKLVEGISVENLTGIKSAYSVDNNGIYAEISGEKIYPLICDLIKKLDEPVFFLLEYPCDEMKEKELRQSKDSPFHYDLYYLDNCTIPVALAIMKRYGQILINDGLSRFGFGAHKTGEEIYCMKYQTISIYGDIKKFEKTFEKNKISKELNFKTLWDNFTDDKPGISSAVEVNGENVYTIIENLKTEGIYLADTIEEN